MPNKNQLFLRIAIYALAVLSLAAGLPKVLQMPQELAFLSSVGLTGPAVSVLGLVQVAGGILLFQARHRLVGAVMAGFVFLVSSIALLMGGNTSFGLFSILPMLVLGILVYVERKGAEPNAA